MAGKIKLMSNIKQLLQLHKQGRGIKYIVRALGISRNTVKTYLAKFKELDIEIDVLLAIDDPLLEKKFHAGNPAYKGAQLRFVPILVSHIQSFIISPIFDKLFSA